MLPLEYFIGLAPGQVGRRYSLSFIHQPLSVSICNCHHLKIEPPNWPSSHPALRTVCQVVTAHCSSARRPCSAIASLSLHLGCALLHNDREAAMLRLIQNRPVPSGSAPLAGSPALSFAEQAGGNEVQQELDKQAEKTKLWKVTALPRFAHRKKK
jgi:hypothetical protein